MILPYLIFICLALGTHGKKKLHEHMTKQEIEKTFNCDHESVHKVNYEVASVLHVDELDYGGQRFPTSNSAIHFRAFDKDISLYLLENDNTLLDSNTPIYLAQTDEHGAIVYAKGMLGLPENFKSYQDRKKRAAVTAYKDEQNKTHVHAVIEDESIVVKPIPSRLHEEILPLYPELYNSSFSEKQNPCSGDCRSGSKPTPHIIIKPKVEVNSSFYKSVEGSFKGLKSNDEGIEKSGLLDELFPHSNGQQPIWPIPTQTPFNGYPSNYGFPARFPYREGPFTNSPTYGWPSYQPIAEDSDIVYPQLLVSVDYETYEFHKHDIKELAKYMAAFWNAVDLRFRELSQPQVRLSIAGFIISQTRNSTPPYYNAYRRRRPHSDTILARETLNEVGRYFSTAQNQFPKQMYDIAVAVTSSKLGDASSGKLETTTLGIAFRRGACNIENKNAVALVQDKGGFDGILTAAHELAHTMGAPHDDHTGDYLPVAPCQWDAGYIMSYERIDSRVFHWSNCSKYAMREFFRSEEGQCLRTIPPNVGKPFPKVLPGRLLSRDEQCRGYFGPGSSSSKWSVHINNCAILWCDVMEYSPEYGTYDSKTKSLGAPAEGSDCGDKAICLDGQCVRDPKVTRFILGLDQL